ncbi:MarR family winged helix-turn-helix transcriptional regulator [Tenacibaculum xiamenense]|uniref:MarR family winged helix-turn-helix transcriptional regulator n=1 Tax=Tenacibaculum xiamenense TaxID=1261553 RepID=UPI003893D7FD
MSNEKVFVDDTQSWYAKGYFSLVRTAGWVDIKLKEALKPFGITHVQLNILSLLAKNHPEPMDAKSIKEKLVVKSPDLTRLLDRLVKKGLIDRRTCPENRRKIDITVTEEGIQTFYDIHCIAKAAVNNYFEDNLSEDDAKELYRILAKIK